MQKTVGVLDILQDDMRLPDKRDLAGTPQLFAQTRVSQATHDLPLGLTSREQEVLRLVAVGHTDREVAEALVISPRTVNRHLSNIFAKLDVPSRAAAVAAAIWQGFV